MLALIKLILNIYWITIEFKGVLLMANGPMGTGFTTVARLQNNS